MSTSADGAGNPAGLPLILDCLARHESVTLLVRVQGATSADGDFAIHFEPCDLAVDDRPVLHRPHFDAIVASVDLATALAADPAARPDGFVVEGHTAGGHNAPPRGPRLPGRLGTFSLLARSRNQSLTVTVADHGRWQPAARPGLLHGRGLPLIHTLADHATIDKETEGTTVTTTWSR